jgi:hypothetical protein
MSLHQSSLSGVIPSQNLPPGAPLVVTVMGDSADTIVNIPGHVQGHDAIKHSWGRRLGTLSFCQLDVSSTTILSNGA